MAKRFLEINPRLQAMLRTLPDTITDGVKDAIRHQADILVVAMKRQLSNSGTVRTGQLIGSIGVANAIDGTRIRDGLALEVGPGLKFRGKKMKRNRMVGRFTEHGTKFNQAKPFVRPAFELRKEKIHAALREAVEEALRKARNR